MNRLALNSIFIIPLFKLGYSQSVDLSFPDSAALPNKCKKSIAGQIVEFKRLFHDDSTDKSYSPIFMLDKIDNDSNGNQIPTFCPALRK